MVIAVVSDKSLNYYKVFSGKHLPNTFEITNTMLKQSYPNMFVYIHWLVPTCPDFFSESTGSDLPPWNSQLNISGLLQSLAASFARALGPGSHPGGSSTTTPERRSEASQTWTGPTALWNTGKVCWAWWWVHSPGSFATRSRLCEPFCGGGLAKSSNTPRCNWGVGRPGSPASNRINSSMINVLVSTCIEIDINIDILLKSLSNSNSMA